MQAALDSFLDVTISIVLEIQELYDQLDQLINITIAHPDRKVIHLVQA